MRTACVPRVQSAPPAYIEGLLGAFRDTLGRGGGPIGMHSSQTDPPIRMPWRSSLLVAGMLVTILSQLAQNPLWWEPNWGWGPIKAVEQRPIQSFFGFYMGFLAIRRWQYPSDDLTSPTALEPP